jgi:hypothetical protein
MIFTIATAMAVVSVVGTTVTPGLIATDYITI